MSSDGLALGDSNNKTGIVTPCPRDDYFMCTKWHHKWNDYYGNKRRRRRWSVCCSSCRRYDRELLLYVPTSNKKILPPTTFLIGNKTNGCLSRNSGGCDNTSSLWFVLRRTSQNTTLIFQIPRSTSDHSTKLGIKSSSNC